MPCVEGLRYTDSSRSTTAGADKRGERRQLLLAIARTLLTSAVLLVLYFVLPLDRSFTVGTLLALIGGIAATGVLVAWQLRSILRSRHPALRAVEALALSLPLFLLLFAAAYAVLSGSQPAAFTEPLNRVDCLYFVVTVFATVGFGDISAASQLARVLVTVQMVGDLLLIGLVLRAFLTAVERGRRRRTAQQDAPPAGPR
jgi:voltage-gated potassium channel